jgi:hypothetical protein
LLAFAGTYVCGRNSLGETRRLAGDKEPLAPQNAPNIVKQTAGRS